MRNNLVALAEADHDCRGFDGCQICTAAFFARSREKWSRFKDRMALVRAQSGHIDAQIVAAVMSKDKGEE